jgi:hypothetical protein
MRKPARAVLMMLGTIAVACPLLSAGSPSRETIQATYMQGGNAVGVTLIVYTDSTASDLQVLSLAFQEGQDRGLASALASTKAVGQCTIAGAHGYDIAFIQTVVTPTGRRITFITSRPHPPDEAAPDGTSQQFDLAVGQFDLNDTDATLSTGFLFPASKLVIDDQGKFHYDLAGNPWVLANVLDLNRAGPLSEPKIAEATGPEPAKEDAASFAH